MSKFLFHRELDTHFFQDKYKDDLYTARAVIGSFVEITERELLLLEHAYEQKQMLEFARLLGRLDDGLEQVGLNEEKNRLKELRSNVALAENDAEHYTKARLLLDTIRDKTSLLRIEVQRLDQHLEKSVRQ